MNLRQWLVRLRNNIIADMELPETPDKSDAAFANKQKTAQNVQAEANNDLQKLNRASDDDSVTDVASYARSADAPTVKVLVTPCITSMLTKEMITLFRKSYADFSKINS